MSAKYADIIIDISHEAIDRTFQYRIPETMQGRIRIGSQVMIPFGKGDHIRSGYVVSFSDEPLWDPERIKSVAALKEGSVPIESSLIELAAFIRQTYGSTMINALKTVMPIKEKVKGLTKKEIRLLLQQEQIEAWKQRYTKKHATARLRLLEELESEKVLPYRLVTGKMNIPASTIRAMEKDGILRMEEEGYARQLFGEASWKEPPVREQPNAEQQKAIDRVYDGVLQGGSRTYLLKGVTGSGKTLVYIEIIEKVLAMGKQAIVLIPEIALTYQTVKRFRNRFGEQVTIMNSRLSKGERYEQFEKAKKGEVSVMIGPRSALFAPFPNLGIIVIDEEHETTYKSEYPPRYHAREVAIQRASMSGAVVLLGSATPSVESYYKAVKGEYELLELTKRAREDARLAQVEVVDLRRELREGNRSIFSRHLQQKLQETLQKGQQAMLFLNRRGFAGFVSCRSCGHVWKCPHCDVSLTEHFSGTPRAKLVCHYCGYEMPRPKECPECHSAFIAGFGIGTQKVEEQVRTMFPKARVLRMDMDTTRSRDAYENILNRFANREADILVGTQMIVKGHDFSNVTLVGVVAADLTLFDQDYRSGERTFDLLTQAAGRAGRGSLPGEVVIQTYQPEHYCIQTAARQDYEAFFQEEQTYRSMLSYPPFCEVLAVCMEQEDRETLVRVSESLCEEAKECTDGENLRVIGPCDAVVARINDRYRRVFYVKHKEAQRLIAVKDRLERFIERHPEYKECTITFDFNPMHAY